MSVHHQDPWLTVHVGDCRAVLATMEAESVHTVVTSPPYWGLRDYGTATWEGGDADCDHKKPNADTGHITHSTLGGGKATNAAQVGGYRSTCGKCGATRQDAQLGLEPTPEQYVENMVAVFREVRRVLRSDGTLWLNLGDSYFGTGKGPTAPTGMHGQNGTPYPTAGVYTHATLKGKDLVGIPWRVAFALQADGWYLRSDIIWSKPNPMPESVTDRPTKAHEYLFLLAKSERYYFDADAVREPMESGPSDLRKMTEQRDRIGGLVKEQSDPKLAASALTNVGRKRSVGNPPAGRNIRSVWTIATQPYPGAHFATFPPKLVEPCILAGTSERGVCPECGAPWRRVVERERAREGATPTSRDTKAAGNSAMVSLPAHARTDASKSGMGTPAVTTTGWRPTCTHDATPVPATVLDPFGGSGTTAMVAQHLSRRAVLIDLNPDYIDQQLKRNQAMPLGLEAA